MSAGEGLRRARVARGFSQARLSALSGVSERTIRQLERDRARHPHASTLLALADALRLGADDRARFAAAFAGSRSATLDLLAATKGSTVPSGIHQVLKPFLHSLDYLHMGCWVTVGRDRCITVSRYRGLVRARRDGVPHMFVVERPEGLRPGRLVALQGCRSGRAWYFAREHLSLHEVTFETPLRQHEVASLDYEIEYDGRCAEPTTSVVRGSGHHLDMFSLTLELERAPERIDRVEVAPGAPPRVVEQVRVGHASTVSVFMAPAAPGSYGFQLTW
ncbi:helix-turn-helix transcriptional regulator [Luteipulveratus sp. YIM 133132]|uniref:helix-turn-helix domain-containing protein n=1 Tax=Luteipulveratus flavus TaxID=3031728 RepID=UPI0023AFD9CC|nr:helix-turn-helix transcriptional regulator [Luteipulveratus sp. YIM 133132]MDE9364747.1 helix-turn-helix transcriptional regulator [Luteipulveratus sp. YIM 133132]